VLTGNLWWTALGVTVFITVVSVAVELVLAMALALVMRWTLMAAEGCAPWSWSRRGSSRWSPPTAGSTPGPGHRLPGQPAPQRQRPLTSQWPAILIIILAAIW
jgi:multiple sugar transport system permease protein